MNTKPTRRPDIEINPVSDGYVVYDPHHDQVHYLNQTAAFVLEFCTGDADQADIAESVRAAYQLDEPIDDQVTTCIEQLRTVGLVT